MVEGRRLLVALLVAAGVGAHTAVRAAEPLSFNFTVADGATLDAETEYGYYPVKGSDWIPLVRDNESGREKEDVWEATSPGGASLKAKAHAYFFWHAGEHPLLKNYVDDGTIPNTKPDGDGATITVQGLDKAARYEVALYFNGDNNLAENAFRPVKLNGTWVAPGRSSPSEGELLNWGALTDATRGAPALGVNAFVVAGQTFPDGTLKLELPPVHNNGQNTQRANGRACISAIQLIPMAGTGRTVRDVAGDAPWNGEGLWQTGRGPTSCPDSNADIHVRTYAPSTLTLVNGVGSPGPETIFTAEGSAPLTLARAEGVDASTTFASTTARGDLIVEEGFATALGKLDIPVQSPRKAITLPPGRVPVAVASGAAPAEGAYAYVQDNGNCGFIRVRGGSAEAPLRMEMPDDGAGIYNGGLGELRLGRDTVAELHLGNDAPGAHRNYVVAGEGAETSTLRLTSEKAFGFKAGQRSTWLRNLTLETPGNAELYWRTIGSSADASVNLKVGGTIWLEPMSYGGVAEALTFGTLSGGEKAKIAPYTTDSASLTFTQTADTTYAGAIAPGISLTVAGDHSLTLTGANDTPGSRTLTVKEGAALRLEGAFAAKGTAVEGTLTAVGDKTLGAELTGKGRLIAESGTLTLAETDASAFEGTVDVRAGAALALGANRPRVALAEGAALTVTATESEVALGSVALPFEGGTLPANVTVTLFRGDTAAPHHAIVADGRLVLTLANTGGARWEAEGDATWAQGLPGYAEGSDVLFGANGAGATVTLEAPVVAGALSVQGAYAFAGDALTAAGLTLGPAATLTVNNALTLSGTLLGTGALALGEGGALTFRDATLALAERGLLTLPAAATGTLSVAALCEGKVAFPIALCAGEPQVAFACAKGWRTLWGDGKVWLAPDDLAFSASLPAGTTWETIQWEDANKTIVARPPATLLDAANVSFYGPGSGNPAVITLPADFKVASLLVSNRLTLHSVDNAEVMLRRLTLTPTARLCITCPFNVWNTWPTTAPVEIADGGELTLGDGTSPAPEKLPLDLSSTSKLGPDRLPRSGTVALNYGTEATVKVVLDGKWERLTLACASDVCVTGNNNAFTGTFEVRDGATLRSSNTGISPFGVGTVRVLAGGTLRNDHSRGNTQARIPNVEGAGDVILGGGKPVIAGRVANTGTLTVGAQTMVLPEGSVAGPDVALNARLYPSSKNTTSTLTIANGKTLRGAGASEVPLIFAEGAALDLTEGVPIAEVGATFQGALTVRLPEGATPEGALLLKAPAGVAFPALTVEGHPAAEESPWRARHDSAQGGYVLTAERGLTFADGLTDGLAPEAVAALTRVAVEAGLTEVKAITVRTKGAVAEGVSPADVLACFAPEGLISADAETQTLTLAYAFGIAGLRVMGKEALIVVKATTGEGVPLAFAEGAGVVLSGAETLGGAWLEEAAAKPCDRAGRLSAEAGYVTPEKGVRCFRIPIDQPKRFWRVRVRR